MCPGPVARACVRVRLAAGQRASDEVLQVYSSWQVAAGGHATPGPAAVGTAMRVPVRQLVAFVRLRDLKPAERRAHRFEIKPQQCAVPWRRPTRMPASSQSKRAWGRFVLGFRGCTR